MKLSELTNAQLVCIALARLGGDSRTIDTEDIAIEVFKISPKRFCWRKYPDRIDLVTVRVALADALRTSPPLVQGGIRDGWMVTPDATKWVSGLPAQLIEIDIAKRGSFHAIVEAEKTRLRSTTAFAKFQLDQSATLSIMDLNEFARVNEYFPARQRQERVRAIDNATQDDAELSMLWRMFKDRFAKELSLNEKQ